MPLEVKNISIDQVEAMPVNDYLCIDTRDQAAYRHGHIPAVHWDYRKERGKEFPKDKKLIVYCTYGENSVFPTEILAQRGFDAYDLSGGYREWLLFCFEELSEEEVQRYDRQMILPEVGNDGQKKRKQAKVLIVGAGGLGSPAALYLAGAGVGHIGIMDADVVTISNLQRQIVHNMESEGVNNAESAKRILQKLNDNIEIVTYPFALKVDHAEEIIRQYDFILDAVDNFETKFLINDVCVLLKKPFCHAGILRFEGQVMTYVPGEFPCYRCVFEEVPPESLVQSCSEAGIIGAVAGIIGSIQALEAIKYLLGAGELLTGKMLVFNGLTMKMRIAGFEKKNRNFRVQSRYDLNLWDNLI